MEMYVMMEREKEGKRGGREERRENGVNVRKGGKSKRRRGGKNGKDTNQEKQVKRKTGVQCDREREGRGRYESDRVRRETKIRETWEKALEMEKERSESEKKKNMK